MAEGSDGQTLGHELGGHVGGSGCQLEGRDCLQHIIDRQSSTASTTKYCCLNHTREIHWLPALFTHEYKHTIMSDGQSGASDDLSGLTGFFFYVFIVHPCTAWILRPGRFPRKKSIIYAIAFLAGLAAIKTGAFISLGYA